MRSNWALHFLCLTALITISGGCGHHEDPAAIMDELIGEAEQTFQSQEPPPGDEAVPGEEPGPAGEATEAPVVEEGPPPEPADVPAPEPADF